MRIQVTDVSAARRSDLLAVLLPEGARLDVDHPAASTARALIGRKEWTPRFRETLVLWGGANAKARLLLVGLGKEKDVDAERLRRGAAIAYAKARSLAVGSLGIVVLDDSVRSTDAGNALAEGLALAAYRAPLVRKATEKDDGATKGPRQVRIGVKSGTGSVTAGVERGEIVADAVNIARRLGELPGNKMTPTMLGDAAARAGREHGFRVRVHRKGDLARMKMGGILGVALGSSEPPVLIEMHHRPRRYKKTVCLVGKGLTFDSGGISLKPSASMEEMKYDMCGGAAVIGALTAAARLDLPVRVVGIVPSSENMPDASAQKPGDILTTASGLTVEVINTDAEGRLILADGLHVAKSFDPDYTVDLATLTGAIVIALGHDVSGMFTTDKKLSDLLRKAGDECGDRVWPMPIYPEYSEDMKSTIADLKNSGRREAGAGTAAWFLSNFADGQRWAHLDIAGTAWGGRNKDYYAAGASGAGVRLLVRFLESLA